MKKIHIIFANRKDCFEKSGGDTIQMIKTKEYLEKLYPVKITICLTSEEIEQYDKAKIVHIFNLETINETNAFIEAAKKHNKKVVLSTIHWNLLDNYYVKYLNVLGLPPIPVCNFFKIIFIKFLNLFIFSINILRTKYRTFIDKGMYCTLKYKKERIKAIKNADVLLPNSLEEMELCHKDFKLNKNYIKNKSVVIPNATDFNQNLDYEESYYHSLNLPSKYVLTVGRIESAKNQYSIIKALFKNKDIGIVIVGVKENKKAYSRLRNIAQKRGNVFFLGKIDQKNLISLYKNAICHCLPSFSDTTGLVNLEALLCGCPIVTSSENYCPVNFYEFNKYGVQCNPYSTKSIREAIFKIINNNKRIELPNEYKEKISYQNVAKQTFAQYIKLLKEDTL